jgi:hypothetical protein
MKEGIHEKDIAIIKTKNANLRFNYQKFLFLQKNRNKQRPMRSYDALKS